MPDESTNPVWTAQTPQDNQSVTNQTWDDFVLDFGGTWDSTLTSDSEINVEWINNSEIKDEMDLDLSGEDAFDESRKWDDQEHNINIEDLDTIISETQNNDFDISLGHDHEKQEIKDDSNEISFPVPTDENNVSENTESVNEESTETGITINDEEKIASDNENDVPDNLELQANFDEPIENATDNEDILKDDQIEKVEDNVVEDIDSTEDKSDNLLEDSSISIDEKWDLDNNATLNDDSTWEDNDFDMVNQNDSEEVEQKSELLIDWEGTTAEKIEISDAENNWSIEPNLSQDDFGNENLLDSDDISSTEEQISIQSDLSQENVEIDDNKDVPDNSLAEKSEESANVVWDYEAQEVESSSEVFNNKETNISAQDFNDKESVDWEIKQPELSDLLWNDSDIDFSWESLDDSTQEEFNDADGSDSVSENEDLNDELNIDDQANEVNDQVDEITDQVDEINKNVEAKADENNVEDTNFTFDYPGTDNQTSSDIVDTESIWDEQINQNSKDSNSDVLNNDSNTYGTNPLNDWTDEILTDGESEAPLVEDAVLNAESQTDNSNLDSNDSEDWDTSLDEVSINNNGQEISSTLSLDQILDSELTNNPQLSDNSKASPNNVSTNPWLMKNKKIVMFTAWIWVLLAWCFVVLAFPSKNTERWVVQNDEIREYQEIDDNPVDDSDHQAAYDGQSINDQDIDEDEYVANKPSAWWVAIDIPQDFWTDTEDIEDISQNDSSNSVVKPYLWCDEDDPDCNTNFNENEENSVTNLTPDEIIPEIESLKSVAQNYHTLWYTNKDKILIKYASQAINLCDKYEQQVNSGEMLDEESFELFKAEFYSIHHKMDSYIWSGNEVETFVQGNFDEEYDFEDKDEVREYINKRANGLI